MMDALTVASSSVGVVVCLEFCLTALYALLVKFPANFVHYLLTSMKFIYLTELQVPLCVSLV